MNQSPTDAPVLETMDFTAIEQRLIANFADVIGKELKDMGPDKVRQLSWFSSYRPEKLT